MSNVANEGNVQPVQLAKLLGQLFIARPETKAIQNQAGEYRPLRGEKFTKQDLLDHLTGTKTYGHYMIDDKDQVKLFCFDIDLEQTGKLPISKSGLGAYSMFTDTNPREDWMKRKPGAGRDFIKLKLRMLAGQLMSAINALDIQTAAAYSGSKGVHVYGFLGGRRSAKFAREGAAIVLDTLKDKNLGHWELSRGKNFYAYDVSKYDDGARVNDPNENYSQFSLEVYPKQDSLDGKDLGNLLRLPLGINRKSPKDRGFFLDVRTALTEFVPRDPIEALTVSNQWQ